MLLTLFNHEIRPFDSNGWYGIVNLRMAAFHGHFQSIRHEELTVLALMLTFIKSFSRDIR